MPALERAAVLAALRLSGGAGTTARGAAVVLARPRAAVTASATAGLYAEASAAMSRGRRWTAGPACRCRGRERRAVQPGISTLGHSPRSPASGGGVVKPPTTMAVARPGPPYGLAGGRAIRRAELSRAAGRLHRALAVAVHEASLDRLGQRG
ncbi:hypothetical protein SMALB_3607 [Streptomyces malaysiensis]|uniref:Uncharacterized protein n=1 Tax=Streptomyces malaysiensis TaxID=92644 RepID=A0A7X6AY02_STRMQ|nr:hypothetical protein [Streptomyces malaysiensis]